MAAAPDHPADPAPGARARLVEIRPGERRAVGWAFAYFFALLAGYYVLRAVREEMGIRGGVERLHESFLATFLVMLLAVPAWSVLVGRVPRARAIPIVYRVFLAFLVSFLALVTLGVAPPLVARAFYVWVSVYGLFVVSVFWSYVADLFSSEQGRRLFGAIAAGGSAGAIAGPLLAGSLAGLVGVPGLLAMSAVLLEVATVCAGALGRTAPPRHDAPTTGPAAVTSAASGDGQPGAPVGGGALAGLTLTLRSPYLLAIAGLMLFTTSTATIVYFQQARLVSELLPDSAVRLRLFSAVDLAVNVLSLALQSAAFARLVRWLGLGAALAFHPLVALLGLLAVAAAPALVVVAAVQGLRRVTHYSVERPAREVLFTVVGRDARYQAKSFIDTIVYRGGDALAAQGAAALAAAGVGLGGTALAAAPLCLAWLALVAWVWRRHAALEAAR